MGNGAGDDNTGSTPADASRDSVKSWRRALRVELRKKRLGVPRHDRARFNQAIEAVLYPMLMDSGARVISLYLPFGGEFDTRHLMQHLHDEGICVALPDVVERWTPLVFRPWRPGIGMRRDAHGFHVPDTDEKIIPETVVAAPLGFDDACYRLGNGGGYYDRTMAVLPPVRLFVGAGYECCRIDTIRPAAHDIPMQCVVTETGAHFPSTTP